MKTPPRRILVIGLRRLGDLLLATALIRSLKRAWPDAVIDVLTSAGSEAVLQGNADVAEVLTFRRGGALWPLMTRLFRRYDLSVSLQAEDRAQGFALLAAPYRVSIIPPHDRPSFWKRRLNHVVVEEELHWTHAVRQYLKLAEGLGIAPIAKLVPPEPANLIAWHAERSALGPRYAVIHPQPMYAYKAWTIAGWQALITHLRGRGLAVALTGGPAAEERAQLASIAAGFAGDAGVRDLGGRLPLAMLTPLLRGAQVFVGPDTSVTHLAAACGTPMVALSGPSNPVGWGPWPAGTAPDTQSPWGHTAPLQQRGTVTLLQGTHGRFGACIPCMQEGCERRRDSTSDCLTQLEPARVIAAVDALLDDRDEDSGATAGVTH